MTTRYRKRADWTDFRSLETLGRRAGVALRKIPALLVKELVDNALDVNVACTFGVLPGGGFFVRDEGPGIPGTDAQLASLFSISRPLTSTKMVRMPTRGALGNGLRVVVGAVLASQGSLWVRTRGRSLDLVPQDQGHTVVRFRLDWEGTGTEVAVRLGPDLPTNDEKLFEWARWATLLAGRGTGYAGHSSPWWYTPDAFWDLLQASGNFTVRQFVEGLEGCAHQKAGAVTGQFLTRRAASLDRQEAAELLARAREQSQRVNPERLGAVGELAEFSGYSKPFAESYVQKRAQGKLASEIPYVVEAWSEVAEEPSIVLCVNRTPVTAEVTVFREEKGSTEYVILGCGLSEWVEVGRNRDFRLLVNVQTPHLPLTTDGKAPDLQAVRDKLSLAVEKAVRRTKRRQKASASGKPPTKKAAILAGLPEAIRHARGEEGLRYSLRQLFYALRPYYLKVWDAEPSYGYFAKVITDREAELGSDLPGIYRDTRGILYHPHTQERIPLGTLAVEAYERPDWTFNKILYCEKEGLFPVLLDNRWPERPGQTHLNLREIQQSVFEEVVIPASGQAFSPDAALAAVGTLEDGDRQAA